jgi:hypothetical protein
MSRTNCGEVPDLAVDGKVKKVVAARPAAVSAG